MWKRQEPRMLNSLGRSYRSSLYSVKSAASNWLSASSIWNFTSWERG